MKALNFLCCGIAGLFSLGKAQNFQRKFEIQDVKDLRTCFFEAGQYLGSGFEQTIHEAQKEQQGEFDFE